MKKILILVFGLLPTITLSAESSPEEVTRAFAQALNDRDANAMKGLLDVDALGKRVAVRIFDSPSDRNVEAFLSGFREAAPNVYQSLASLGGAADGQAKFLRVRQLGGETFGLVRIDFETEGLNYVDLLIKKNSDGDFVVADLYSLTNGELLSETMTGVAQVMNTPSPSLLERIFGGSVDASARDKILSFVRLYRAGKLEAALDAYESLPPKVQDTRQFLVLASQIAGLMDDESQWLGYLNELAEKHGDHPSTAFMLIDHYLLTGQYDAAMEGISAMEKRVGVDGATTNLRAATYIFAGELEQARRAAQNAIKIEPTYEEPYFSMVQICVDLEDYACAVEHYQMTETRFGYEYDREVFDDPQWQAENPVYVPFVNSPEFKEWIDSR